MPLQYHGKGIGKFQTAATHPGTLQQAEGALG
jgi:hypothetical protein